MSCGFFNMPEYMDQQYPRAALRHQISTFHQLPSELFWQAWRRFDGYRRTRPHHGYSDVELLQFFYYGVRRYFQVELDVAGFWDLCAEYTQGAYTLCDNMAFSSHDNPMAELEAQIYCLKEEANKRKDVGFNAVEQEQINRSSFQGSTYCDLGHPYYDQEYTPPPQNQIPTPQPSKSQTTIEEIKAMFYNWNLETKRIVEEIKEEAVATKKNFDSKLITSDTPMRMVGNQVDEKVEVTESQQGTLPMCKIVEDEMEKIDSEPAVVGAEIAEEINLQPLPELVEALEEEVGAAESKEEMLEFIEEPPPVATVQEETPTLDEGAQHSELCVENEDMSFSDTCLDPLSVKTEDISSTENQTRHGFCAEDILENAAMPRTGPDKSEDRTVSQFDRVVHNDIGDSLANRWSMSKKGNGFPWDDGISRELKLSNDPGLDGGNFWVSNLLQPPLILDQNRGEFLIKDGGTPAGIPRTGPDIPSFHEFDQSQFLRFAGEGGCITYCDVIGSVTRPPEVLLNVPVVC